MTNDPSAKEDPGYGESAPVLTLDEAKGLANGEPVAFRRRRRALAKNMPIDIAQLLSFLNACTSSQPRVGYMLGAKIPSDASKPGNPAPPGFTAVDCSGFVRAALRRSTNTKAINFPDGSVVQHDWVKAQGYEISDVDDGEATDGVIRIAFLAPSDSDHGVGHVVLIHGGSTMESHGGVGPDRRVWNTLSWRKQTEVFRLT